MRRKLILLLSGVAIFLSASSLSFAADSPKPPPLATDGPKPFLSQVAEKLQDPADPVSYLFRPAKGSLESPYSDVPFAVHVPLEVRHEGGIVRITYNITAHWKDPPAAGGPEPSSAVWDIGLYRPDGKALAADSVLLDPSATADPKGWFKLASDTDTPIPTFVYAGPGEASTRIAYEAETHAPFGVAGGDEPSIFGGGGRQSLMLAPAEPGWYVLWFALDYTWPGKELKRQTLSGELRVDILVSRGERVVPEAEIAFLFGRGERPEDMTDDTLFRASTVTIPIELNRNGWVFDHSEIKLLDEEFKDGRVRMRTWDDDVWWEHDLKLSAQASGSTPELALEATAWLMAGAGRPAEITKQEKYRWAFRFPDKVPDYGFATVSYGGSSTHTINKQARFFSDYGLDPNDPGAALNAPAALASWLPQKTFAGPTADTPGMGQHNQVMTQTRIHREGDQLSFTLEQFTNLYGPDAAEWWFDDPRPYEVNTDHSPGEGGAPYRQLIKGEPPRYERKYVTGAGGPYPLLAYEAGPWLVTGHYRRASEASPGGDVPSTGELSIVVDLDPFWKWYPSLSRLIFDRVAKAAVAETLAMQEAMPLQELLRSSARLSQSLVSDSLPAAPSWQAFKDGATVRQLAGDMGQRIGRTIEDAAGSSATAAAVSGAAFAQQQKELTEISAEIHERRVKFAQYTKRARAALADILAKLEEGFIEFADRPHPELLIWKAIYRPIYERMPFEFALAAKDPEMLRTVLAEAETEAQSATTRVLEAQLYLSEGNPVGALYALRSAVRVDPNDPVAQKMLADLESSFLQNAIAKSQGAIREARAAFYGYLLERGFEERAISPQAREDVQGPVETTSILDWTGTRAALYAEDAWAVFTTGLFGSFSAFAGKPAAQADLLATTERQMTTAYVGLHTILRLRRNGYTFDQIRNMTSLQIRDALPLRDLQGNLYSEAHAANHAVAIREAMTLPDVQALVTDDRIGLQIGLQKAYWNSKDVGDTWIEWIGDITSAYNLFMMLPMAKVGMAGRAGLFWTASDIAMMQELEKLGKVMSGTERVANLIGLQRVLGGLGATERGQKLLEYVKRVGKYEAGLAWYDKAIWTTGKITGALAFATVTVLATEHLVGHKAAMLVAAALMFGTDSDLLIKLLQSRGIPPDKIGALIINQYLPATQVHIKRIAAMEKTSAELGFLFERVKKGKPLAREDFVFLDKHFGAKWRKLIPNGTASHDAAIALQASAEGARNGVNNGALQAVVELQPALTEEAAAAAQAAKDAQKLADDLNRAVANAPPVPPLTAQPPITPRNLKRATFKQNRGARELGAYPKPPAPKPGSKCATAEALLHAGKYREAQQAYDEIIEGIIRGELFIADELPLEYIHLRRSLAYKLQTFSNLPRPLGPLKLSLPIPPSEVEKILNNRSLWRGNLQKGAMADVFVIEGMDDYFVKVINRDRVGDVLADVQGNMAHADLARALGFDVPAMEVRLVYDAQGKVEQAIYVMRKVDGVEGRRQLADLSAAEIFLYKEELSRHRALSVLLGDYDRKIDNYMITKEGRLIPIDAGMADVTGDRIRDAGFAVDADFTLEGGMGRDHWYSRFYKDELNQGANAPVIKLWSPDEEFARKGLVAEEALTYQAAKPTVDDITKLVNDESRLRSVLEGSFEKIYATEAEIQRVTQRLGSNPLAANKSVEELRQLAVQQIKGQIDDRVDQAVETLRVRAAKLDKVMQGLNERNAIPLSYLYDGPRLRDEMQDVVFLQMVRTRDLGRLTLPRNFHLRRAA